MMKFLLKNANEDRQTFNNQTGLLFFIFYEITFKFIQVGMHEFTI